MSSGQWEIVGKNKKVQNGKIKNMKDDDKKAAKSGPKLEDVLPHSQIKSLYGNVESNDDKKPGKDKKKEADKKAKKQDKKSEPLKPKPPKTLEAAFEYIDLDELKNVISSNKIRFSNAPLVWLKEVASFFNSKLQIDVEDPTFSNCPSNYPLCVLPSHLKQALENVIHDAGKANAQLFFDITLIALANDMSRGLFVNGHRLIIQILAQTYPEFCIASISKSVSLRNSYQNRPPIGLSLLWGFGQGGINFAVGLKVWQELFLPIIELKSYTKYIILYLSNLLDKHGNLESTKITQDQLLTMFDLINSKKNNIPKELSSDLIQQLSKFKDIYFNKCNNKLQVTFNQLMKKLPNQYLSGSALDNYNLVLVESLVNCLERDDSSNPTWRQLFNKCTKQSATLLDYINSNWFEVGKKLKLKSLKITVLQYKEVSKEALKGKKKDDTVARTNKICQDILDKMTSTRRFPWLWASFFLLVSIVGLVAYDVSRVGGNFPKSSTGKLLNDLGILEQSQRAWQKTLSTSARGYLWVESNAVVYYAQASEAIKPYSQVSKDFFIIALKKAGILYENVKDYIIEKTPVVVNTIEQYAPGLVDNVQAYAVAGFTTVKKYSNDYYQLTAEYLKTKVFVGEWAPEILQNKTQLALNVTRSHMSSYFHWFREQVHVYSEIP